MNRVTIVKDYVYSKYANIYNNNIRMAALTHTSAVVNNALFLAKLGNENEELIEVAALFHDFALFYENALPKNHGKRSSDLAKVFLESTNMFQLEEINQIVQAIALHSEKNVVHSPFDEILKNADLLAKYLVEKECKDYEKKRLEDAYQNILSKSL